MSYWTKSFLLSFSLTWFAIFSAHAKDFSSWTKYTEGELIAETNGFAPGALGTVGFKIKLAKHWHTYWLNPGDSGTPISLDFKTDPKVKVERVLFPMPKRFVSGPLISFGYENEVLIPIEVQLSADLSPGTAITVEINAEWLVCEDVCIPAFKKLRLDVPVVAVADLKPSPEFPQFRHARSQIPLQLVNFPRFQERGEQVLLELPPEHAEDKIVDFFAFRGSGVTNARPELVKGTLQFAKANVAASDARRVGVLVVQPHGTGPPTAIQFGDSGWRFETKTTAAASALWWMLLSAFLGGLILNLMPCVFPILSIKLMSLLTMVKAHPREVRRQNMAYVVGVLLSFIGIALTLSLLRSAGHLLGWGFQLQSPVFLSLLSWLFFVLSLNLLGVFEVDLINANWGHRLTRFGGLWGSFFTGVLAVVVASPCTAPFMGVALGFGLSQSTWVLVAIFFALGLGLAFPYLIFVMFPSWTRFLPKPGAWMNLVKQIMAFPLLLTTLWLLWILGQVRGNQAVMVVLVGCLTLGFTFWLAHGKKLLARVLAAFVLTGGVIYIYRSERVIVDKVVDGVWQTYSDARFSSLKGQNVFINLTADWCLTCKVNERLVFDDAEVLSLLKTKKITLLKGDWTQRNEEVTRFLNRYDRVGVPFYALFSTQHPQGRLLPEVLTKSGFMDVINEEYP